jgi:pimeloyl-ACP methyl ester carboxylesterase
MTPGDGSPPAATSADEHPDALSAPDSGAQLKGNGDPLGAPTWTRRRVLAFGIGGFVSAAFAGFELVEHGVLPGKQTLDELDGACSVSSPTLTFATAGPAKSGQFFSSARNRMVGYTIAYPPGHGPGSRLPLAISLHGFGGNHTSGLGGVTLSQALAARENGRSLPPIALVSVDGGGLYWNPHPGDDPMAMIVHELIPTCQRLGLGRSSHGIGAIGISMGGYGALLLAEKNPQLIGSVAAISPAVWTTYAEARAANAGAFASAADFATDDVITHASALAGIPVLIASGTDDPFHPGVVALGRALPKSAIVHITSGCHDGAFFASQQHASLGFLGAHLA